MRFTLDGEMFELDADAVRSRIGNHAPEPIREYWVEIDGVRWPVKQVISLATGVKNRQRFQSQSPRRWLANLGFVIGAGSIVTAATAPSTPAMKPLAVPSRSPQVTPDLAAESCQGPPDPAPGSTLRPSRGSTWLITAHAEVPGVPKRTRRVPWSTSGVLVNAGARGTEIFSSANGLELNGRRGRV